jgi:hypothetical protein
MIDTYLVSPKTAITAKGDSAAVDISVASNRVFLLLLEITEIVEQESLDVSLYGAASDDAAAWGKEPLASFPQKFYCGQHPLLLDLTAKPEIKFVRAHWEVNRWGRGSETPTFVFSVKLTEVAPELLHETSAKAR